MIYIYKLYVFQSQISKAAIDTLYTVSIDFWEQYDPSEVGAKGFALIGSELFHILAICYLCGSAGKEPVSNIYLNNHRIRTNLLTYAKNM